MTRTFTPEEIVSCIERGARPRSIPLVQYLKEGLRRTARTDPAGELGKEITITEPESSNPRLRDTGEIRVTAKGLETLCRSGSITIWGKEYPIDYKSLAKLQKSPEPVLANLR